MMICISVTTCIFTFTYVEFISYTPITMFTFQENISYSAIEIISWLDCRSIVQSARTVYKILDKVTVLIGSLPRTHPMGVLKAIYTADIAQLQPQFRQVRHSSSVRSQ